MQLMLNLKKDASMSEIKPDSIAEISTAMDNMISQFHTLKSVILKKENVITGNTLCPTTGEKTKGDVRENLIKALGDWDIHATSTTGEVIRYPGYFLVSTEVVNAIHAFNEAKEALTTTTKALVEGGASEREIRNAYAKSGFPLIHPLQARRLIRVINSENLKRIGFSIAKKITSVEKINVKLARKRLENNNAFDILNALVNLNETDTVRWHRPVNKHIRANILHENAQGEKQAKMVHASMPIIIDGGLQLPEITFNIPKESHKKRNDELSKNKIALPFIKDGYMTFD